LHGKTPTDHSGKIYNRLTGELLLPKRDKHGRPLWRSEEAYEEIVSDENGVHYYAPTYAARTLGVSVSTVQGFKVYCFWNDGNGVPTKKLTNGGLKRKFHHLHGQTVDRVKRAMADLPSIPEVPGHKYIGHVAEALGLCLRTLRRRMAAAKAKAVKKPAKCKDGRGGRRTYVPNWFVMHAGGNGATVSDGHATLTEAREAVSAEHRRTGQQSVREPLQTQEQQPVYNTRDQQALDLLNKIEQKLPDAQDFRTLREEVKETRRLLEKTALATSETVELLKRIALWVEQNGDRSNLDNVTNKDTNAILVAQEPPQTQEQQPIHNVADRQAHKQRQRIIELLEQQNWPGNTPETPLYVVQIPTDAEGYADAMDISKMSGWSLSRLSKLCQEGGPVRFRRPAGNRLEIHAVDFARHVREREEAEEVNRLRSKEEADKAKKPAKLVSG
jgi:hypothetical protein